mmetsp:Transcript_4966/g.14068  ORF Transcript_4966/g.14068 Transcript_4966/m.14068 type:complete len:253 (+) Transcript_4966:635-1393(+)
MQTATATATTQNVEGGGRSGDRSGRLGRRRRGRDRGARAAGPLRPSREREQLHRERAEEARERGQPDDVAALLECLGHHGLGDHRQHRARRQALDACNGGLHVELAARPRREEQRPEARAHGGDDRGGRPHQEDLGPLDPVGEHAAGGAHALGEVADEDPDDEGQRSGRGLPESTVPVLRALVDQDPYDQGLGYGVDEDAEPHHDRRVGAPGIMLRRCRALGARLALGLHVQRLPDEAAALRLVLPDVPVGH